MNSEKTIQATPPVDEDQRASELLESFQRTIHCRTDRMFAVLMSLQWLGGIVLALTVSPFTWIGEQSLVHLHVWAAIFLGGAITALPVTLALALPGRAVTRHTIAVGQMLTSALLIHLSGGRIETHFHVFGSLAFLAFYRDAKVLLPATLVVALDHYLRGIYWPQSVYGVTNGGAWRWFEHSLWVLFEDFFLFLSIRKSVAELWGIAGQQAQLEATNGIIERRVQERTADLQRSEELLKEACEAAKAANLTKSTFLANMSHEIRTPMTAIIGYTELIKESIVDLGADDALKDLKVVERSSSHLMQLINDLLDLSKVEAGQLEVERITCSPLQIVSDVLSVVSVKASERKIHLIFHCETPIPDQILSDPIRLRQAILNLVGNAVKFTEVGSVTVILRLLGEGRHRKFECEVKDTGIGIPADRIKDLFKPFHQVDPSTTRKYGGTGLGLAVSIHIVRLLGGDITVKSSEGIGSSFTLTMPIEIPVDAQFINSPSVRAMKCDRIVALSRKYDLSARILVVEDNLENQNLLGTHLARCGAEVSLAEDGSIGLKKVCEGRYDVVVMDIQMPVMDGFETIAAIRRQGIDVPVIAVTAHAMKGDRERCLAAGFDAYLPKPVTGQDLYEAVKKLLEKARRSKSPAVQSPKLVP